MTTLTTPTRRQLETITEDKRLIVALERLFDSVISGQDANLSGQAVENTALSRSVIPTQEISEPLTCDIDSFTCDGEFITCDMVET